MALRPAAFTRRLSSVPRRLPPSLLRSARGISSSGRWPARSSATRAKSRQVSSSAAAPSFSVAASARRSAQNVRRLGSSWAHTASIHRLRVLSGRRNSSIGAHHDPGTVGKRRFGVEEAHCRRARIRDRCRRSPSPRSGAPTRPKQSSGTKRRQRDLPCPRTESSNPFPSSGESDELPPSALRHRRSRSSLRGRRACASGHDPFQPCPFRVETDDGRRSWAVTIRQHAAMKKYAPKLNH
jgi:hypothetical protein